MTKLGRLYLRGAGVPQSFVHAFMWLSAAAEASYSPARVALAELLLGLCGDDKARPGVCNFTRAPPRLLRRPCVHICNTHTTATGNPPQSLHLTAGSPVPPSRPMRLQALQTAWHALQGTGAHGRTWLTACVPRWMAALTGMKATAMNPFGGLPWPRPGLPALSAPPRLLMLRTLVRALLGTRRWRQLVVRCGRAGALVRGQAAAGAVSRAAPRTSTAVMTTEGLVTLTAMLSLICWSRDCTLTLVRAVHARPRTASCGGRGVDTMMGWRCRFRASPISECSGAVVG